MRAKRRKERKIKERKPHYTPEEYHKALLLRPGCYHKNKKDKIKQAAVMAEIREVSSRYNGE